MFVKQDTDVWNWPNIQIQCVTLLQFPMKFGSNHFFPCHFTVILKTEQRKKKFKDLYHITVRLLKGRQVIPHLRTEKSQIKSP